MIVITTIDALPNRCYECPCHDGDGYCQADKEQRCSEYRPYWCPLKGITDKDTNVPSKPEIVRCKDCKHYKDGTGMCSLYHAHGCAETWFCADGERR